MRFYSTNDNNTGPGQRSAAIREADKQPIQVDVTVNLSMPSTILCNLSTEAMETTIRFGLTDGIQTNIARGIQAALISKILEEATTISAGAGTVMEDMPLDNRLPFNQQSEDEGMPEPAAKP
ncbi:hypothetical protein C0995_015742 [Termitomyces sp. Mi166|nr:hypothetical protein C0995_015742 [Termitomyces sp. Mi166\